jgi:hypothetical protein
MAGLASSCAGCCGPGVGGYDIWPRWSRRPHLTGKLVLKVGKPFYVSEGPCERVTGEMLQKANQRLRAELERLSDGYMLCDGKTV